jgi:hypothetical protein
VKDVLTPFFPGSLGELLAFLQREEGAKPGDLERVIRAGNHAASHAEMRTRRKLVVRTYRTAVDVASCTVTINSKAATGTGFTAAVKAFDEVVGVGLQPGSRVASVTSNTALVLDREAYTTGTVTLTFGSEKLQVSGDGTASAIIPEYPVAEIYSAGYLDEDGTETAIDTTGYRLGKASGRLVLTNDTFPDGDMNILVACRAGYQEPSATERGHMTEWLALQRLGMRLAQVFYQDEANMSGRVVDRSLSQVSTQIPDFRLPQDIEDLLAQFARVW